MCNRRIELLKRYGLSGGPALRRLLRETPALFTMREEVAESKLRFLGDALQVPRDKLDGIVSKQPKLLVISQRVMESRIQFLRGVGLSDPQIRGCVARHAAVLRYKTEAMELKIKWLASAGFSQQQIVKMVSRLTQILSCDPEANLAPKLQYLTQVCLPWPAVSPLALSEHVYGRAARLVLRVHRSTRTRAAV